MKKNETQPAVEPMPKNKQELLHLIAQKGFEVGYAANLNFATHDIVDKVPVVISFVSMAVGILALVAPVFQLTGVAVCLTLLGILTCTSRNTPRTNTASAASARWTCCTTSRRSTTR